MHVVERAVAADLELTPKEHGGDLRQSFCEEPMAELRAREYADSGERDRALVARDVAEVPWRRPDDPAAQRRRRDELELRALQGR